MLNEIISTEISLQLKINKKEKGKKRTFKLLSIFTGSLSICYSKIMKVL